MGADAIHARLHAGCVFGRDGIANGGVRSVRVRRRRTDVRDLGNFKRIRRERLVAMPHPDIPESNNSEREIVDLARYAKSLESFLIDSVAEFANDHSDVEVSCMALYFNTYGMSVFVNYDTPAHSNARVSEYKENKIDEYYIGQDEAGLFYTSASEFAFAQQHDFVFAELPNFYKVEWPLKFRGLDGKIKSVDSYDEDVGRVLLESFEPALKSFNQFGNLNRSEVFRMGIEVHNTDCRSYWIHNLGQ